MTPEQFESRFFGERIKYPNWPIGRYIIPDTLDVNAFHQRFWGTDNAGKRDWFPINSEWVAVDTKQSKEVTYEDPDDIYDAFLCWDGDIERRRQEIYKRIKGG